MKKYANICLVLFVIINLAGSVGCCGQATKKFLIEQKLSPVDVDRMVREGKKAELQKEIEKGRVAKTAFGYYPNPCYTSKADYYKISCEARKDEAKMLWLAVPVIGSLLMVKRLVKRLFIFTKPEKSEKNQ